MEKETKKEFKKLTDEELEQVTGGTPIRLGIAIGLAAGVSFASICDEIECVSGQKFDPFNCKCVND